MARPKDPNLESLWRQHLQRQANIWSVDRCLLCSRRRFLCLVPRLEATTGRSVTSCSNTAAPVRAAQTRSSSTRSRPIAAASRRDRTAPPGPTPLRLSARARMAGTRRGRTRQPPTPGGQTMIMLPSAGCIPVPATGPGRAGYSGLQRPYVQKEFPWWNWPRRSRIRNRRQRIWVPTPTICGNERGKRGSPELVVVKSPT